MAGPGRPLPYGRHHIDEDDIRAVADCMRSDWLTTGPRVEAFENAFAARVGVRYAAACNSGTAALHLAAAALDLKPGQAAIVPSTTFIATANAVRYTDAEVIFADVDADTGLTGPEHLEAALGRAGRQKVTAAFVVHMNGHVVDMPSLLDLAERQHMAVVEDASHALGATYRDNGRDIAVGACAHSRIAIFSFHPVKNIAMGEGGMVTTNDPAVDKKVKQLRSHGLIREPESFLHHDMAFEQAAVNPWYYELPALGWNYRASDINCALGLSQLGKLDRYLSRRRQLADHYDRLLAPLAPLVRPVPRPPNQSGGWHLYPVLIDFEQAGLSRAQVMRALSAQGIGTQVHYIPVHRQPYYRRRYGDMALPGADAYYARCLSLPLFVAMEDSDIDRVVEALAGILRAQL